MISNADQLAVIDMIAANTEGLLIFIPVAMVSFAIIIGLILMIELIKLNLQSKRFAAFNNNTNAQEGTMANAKQEENKTEETAATEVIVTEELTIRERITNWFENRRKAKIEQIEEASTARVQSLQARIEELQAEIASEGTALKGKVEKAEKPGLMERAVKAGFEKVDAVKNRWSAFKQAVRAKLIQKLDAVPREQFLALEERVAALEAPRKMSNKSIDIRKLALRKDVEALIAEAEEILSSDRAGALAILRDSEIAKKYKVPTNLNFMHTKKRLLKLVA